MNREKALEEVGKCVLRDRNATYGSPEDSFQDIADRWSIFLRRRGYFGSLNVLTPADVAAMMIDLKLARLGANINKADNWIDAAGYAVCGVEVANNSKVDARIIYEGDDTSA